MLKQTRIVVYLGYSHIPGWPFARGQVTQRVFVTCHEKLLLLFYVFSQLKTGCRHLGREYPRSFLQVIHTRLQNRQRIVRSSH